jgi:hypothetical protein
VKLALICTSFLLTVPMKVHSWYPPECCAGHHCHVADSVAELPDGNIRVQVGDDTVTVPRSFSRRLSPDGHYHLCYMRDSGIGLVIFCFYEPGQA